MKSTIRLTGLKASGKHGANPGEQDASQEFIIDLEIEVDVNTDELEQTIDYEEVARLVKAHVRNNSYQLIETMAYNIASELRQSEKINRVLAVVHKPSAAEIIEADDVSARAIL